MNLTRTKLLVMIGGGIALVLVGVSGWLLYRGISRFSEAERTLKRAEVQLDEFYAADPFPSPENVAAEKRNVDRLNRAFEGLLDRLRRGQVEEERRSPSTFMNMLSDTKNRLVRMARTRGVKLPEDFAVGFERYAAQGVLPTPEDVPRLTQQLTILDTLLTTLLEAEVDAVSGISRDVFEEGAPAIETDAAPAARPGRRLPARRAPGRGREDAGEPAELEAEDTELYSRQRFELQFTADESAIRQIMNAFSTHEMFMIVRVLEMQKVREDVLPAAPVTEAEVTMRRGAGSETAAQPIAVPDDTETFTSRRDRLVSGPELEVPMQVRLELDVFRFKGD